MREEGREAGGREEYGEDGEEDGDISVEYQVWDNSKGGGGGLGEGGLCVCGGGNIVEAATNLWEDTEVFEA